jgi:hypothetical protein
VGKRASFGEIKHGYKILFGRPNRDEMAGLRVDWRIILKLALKNMCESVDKTSPTHRRVEWQVVAQTNVNLQIL